MIELKPDRHVIVNFIRKIKMDSHSDALNERIPIANCIEKAIHQLSDAGLSITLKAEQRVAIGNLLRGKDVVAILPTGYGKSIIFSLYVLAKQELMKCTSTSGDSESCSIIVVSPLQSIIRDQIATLASLNYTAVELSDDTFSQIVDKPPQFIYCSAERAIKTEFLNQLKRCDSVLHKRIVGVVVDESHIVESWTGKR